MQLFYSPYLDFIRDAVDQMPGLTEKPCFDTPGFYVGNKLFARMKEDGETLVLYSEEREKWMEADPETFYNSALPELQVYAGQSGNGETGVVETTFGGSLEQTG